MNSNSSRSEEQPAVRTTIVGGRPPGCGKGIGAVPRGIEVMLKKAAVDPAFRRLLLEKRDAAADVISLKLETQEVAMLRTIPAAQLEAIIGRTQVAPGLRKAFLTGAATVMLAALTTTMGCDDDGTMGIRPDLPSRRAGRAAQPANHWDGLTFKGSVRFPVATEDMRHDRPPRKASEEPGTGDIADLNKHQKEP